MFARGFVTGHPTKDVHPELVEGAFSYSTPPLLGRKPSLVKFRVSISSKLIEIKGLQVPYFGHLRKTGGRGVVIPMRDTKANEQQSAAREPSGRTGEADLKIGHYKFWPGA